MASFTNNNTRTRLDSHQPRNHQNAFKRLLIAMLIIICGAFLFWSDFSIKDYQPFRHDKFNSYEAIIRWLEEVSKNRSQLELSYIGESFEKRKIPVLLRRANLSTSVEKINQALIIMTGLHGREWIGPAHLLYFLNKLKNTSKIIQNTDLILIPLANPDGYSYSFTKDRLWRRTRTVWSEEVNFIGADPNRNFPILERRSSSGLSKPSSSSPSSSSTSSLENELSKSELEKLLKFTGPNTYRGPFEASEPSVSALVSYMTEISRIYKKLAFLDVHCCENFILYPFGYSVAEPRNVGILKNISESMVEAIAYPALGLFQFMWFHLAENLLAKNRSQITAQPKNLVPNGGEA